MTDGVLASLVFAIGCMVFGAVVALCLNKWAGRHGAIVRFALAVMASVSPPFAILGGLIVSSGGEIVPTLFSMSPEEFLIPLGIQLAMILGLSVPVIGLISGRGSCQVVPTNVFD